MTTPAKDRTADLISAHAHLTRAAENARSAGETAFAGVIMQLARFVYDLLHPPQPPGEFDSGDDKER